MRHSADFSTCERSVISKFEATPLHRTAFAAYLARFPGFSGPSGRTLGANVQQSPARQHQIGHAEQRKQLCLILRQPPITGLRCLKRFLTTWKGYSTLARILALSFSAFSRSWPSSSSGRALRWPLFIATFQLTGVSRFSSRLSTPL